MNNGKGKSTLGLSGRSPMRTSPKKKPWWEKNLKWITIGLLIFILFQSFNGCLRKTNYRRAEKRMLAEKDSVYITQERKILDLQKIINEYQKENQELLFELRLAGVKADEAEKRAKAIQETAEKIRQNTTIEIKSENKEQ